MRPDRMSEKELKSAGCKLWENGLMALTPELLEECDNATMISVMDYNAFKTKKQWEEQEGGLDLDVRFGCTAYVVKI